MIYVAQSEKYLLLYKNGRKKELRDHISYWI